MPPSPTPLVATARAALTALALLAACQTTRVGRPGEPAEAPDARGEATGAARGPAPEAKARRGQPPVPAAPQGLLTEDGVEAVRRALVDRGRLSPGDAGAGLDEEAAEALRRFQRDEGLAATGFPDRETLRRLGLEPARVYRTTGGDAEKQRTSNDR